jgi:nitrate reductase NapE component
MWAMYGAPTDKFIFLDVAKVGMADTSKTIQSFPKRFSFDSSDSVIVERKLTKSELIELENFRKRSRQWILLLLLTYIAFGLISKVRVVDTGGFVNVVWATGYFAALIVIGYGYYLERKFLAAIRGTLLLGYVLQDKPDLRIEHMPNSKILWTIEDEPAEWRVFPGILKR